MLTIHAGAQRLAESLLAGKCGAAVVLNPKTGAVYVMASTPGFDPNLIEQPAGYAKISATKSPCPPEPAAPLLNRATQGLFPPGSIFKTITAAAALDDGVYKPDSTFDDPGYCTEYGKQVKNALDQSGPEAFGDREPRRGLPALDQRRLLQHRAEARREADPRRGAEVRLLLGAAARDAVGRALGLGPLPQRQALRSVDAARVLARRPGPPRLRAGQDADDAAADGDGRGRGREQRRRDEADADQAGARSRAAR